MSIAKIYETLKKYNFTEYEAKIYVALLRQHPMNGNEISILSGVPSPKVYEAVKKMVERKIVYAVSESTNKRVYIPLAYNELLALLEAEFNQDNAFLSDFFDGLKKEKNISWSELYHIDGYSSSLDTLREMINQAESSIYLSCWNNEMASLISDLTAAQNRGVKIISIVFDEVKYAIPWHHFQHHKGSLSSSKHLGELSCVLDEQRVFILHTTEESAHSIISSHTALSRTAINYIRHDIYINRVGEDFHDELTRKYGPNLEKLLDIF